MSWGHGASNIGTTDYGARFFQFIRERFPHPRHVLHNGAIPGTQSRYMSMCVNWHVPKGVDLVVVRVPNSSGAHINLWLKADR